MNWQTGWRSICHSGGKSFTGLPQGYGVGRGVGDGMELEGEWDMGSGDISLFGEIVMAAFHHACHGDAIGCCFSLSEAGTRQRRAQDVQEVEMAVFRRYLHIYMFFLRVN